MQPRGKLALHVGAERAYVIVMLIQRGALKGGFVVEIHHHAPTSVYL